jgi:ATP-dependent Clp protease ATP-binding subunit ClpC
VVVGPVEIVAVEAIWSGIPVEQLTADEQNRLTNLEKMLYTCFIGQDAAVNAIAHAVQRAHVGLKTPSPHCSHAFLWTYWCWKN